MFVLLVIVQSTLGVSMSQFSRRERIIAALLMAATLSGCESFYQNQADHSAYNMIADRQREALGEPADVKVPVSNGIAAQGDLYDKNPGTANQLPSAQATRPASTQNDDASAVTPAGAPETQPATTKASTQPASSQPSAMMPSPTALLKSLPNIKIATSMPELPKFPKPIPQGRTRLIFTLDDCFAYALAHSREYKSRKEDLYIAALNVTLERHQFDPTLFARTSFGIDRYGESSDYDTALAATQTVGVKQRLPFGGEIVAQSLMSTVNSIQDGTETSPGNYGAYSLSASIPLMRGAGMVAQEDLIQAERNLVYAVRDFERYRRAFLVSVASSYFNLVNQRAQIINRFRSVNSYIFATRRSDAIFRAGMKKYNYSILTVQRAMQSEYSARNDLVNAISSYELAIDNFKLLIGMPTEQSLDMAVQYLAISPPEMEEESAITIARKLRLDLQTERDQVADAQRQVKLAQNNMLPDLKLNASTGMYSGLDGNGNHRWSLAPRANDTVSSAGVTLDLPLDRVAERNQYRTSQINLERARRSVATAEDQVALDVRSALRRVREQQVLLAIQRNNIDLAMQRKDFADMQMRYGNIDNRDYLDAEQALLDAQNRFAQAIANLQVYTLQYMRDTDQLRVDRKGKLLMPPGSVTGQDNGAASTQPTVPAQHMAPSTQEVASPPGAADMNVPAPE